MRLLLDTNVVVSALIWGGLPRQLIEADDDHVIAAALAGEADLIVSGDRHLLSLGQHQGVSIVTVAEAVQRVLKSRPASPA